MYKVIVFFAFLACYAFAGYQCKSDKILTATESKNLGYWYNGPFSYTLPYSDNGYYHKFSKYTWHQLCVAGITGEIPYCNTPAGCAYQGVAANGVSRDECIKNACQNGEHDISLIVEGVKSSGILYATQSVNVTNWCGGGGNISVTITYKYCYYTNLDSFIPDTVCTANGSMWILGINSGDDPSAYTQIATGFGSCADIGYDNDGSRSETAQSGTLTMPKSWADCSKGLSTCGSWKCTGNIGANSYITDYSTGDVSTCQSDGSCTTIDWTTCQGKFSASNGSSSSVSTNSSSSVSTNSSSSVSTNSSSSVSTNSSASADTTFAAWLKDSILSVKKSVLLLDSDYRLIAFAAKDQAHQDNLSLIAQLDTIANKLLASSSASSSPSSSASSSPSSSVSDSLYYSLIDSINKALWDTTGKGHSDSALSAAVQAAFSSASADTVNIDSIIPWGDTSAVRESTQARLGLIYADPATAGASCLVIDFNPWGDSSRVGLSAVNVYCDFANFYGSGINVCSWVQKILSAIAVLLNFTGWLAIGRHWFTTL